MSQEDATALLNEFVWSIENLPNEVAYLLEEIAYKDERAQDLRHKNSKRDASIQSHHKANGLLAVNAKEGQLVDKIRTDQKKVLKLADEKVALAEKGVRLLEKWVSRLDGEFDRLKDMGYNVGDAEAAAQQAANPVNMNMPGLSGPMQMDSGSNKKRKLQASGSGTSANGSFSQASALPGMNMNNNQYHHLQSSNPYSPTSQAGPSGTSNNPGMHGNLSINTSGITPQQAASMANFNMSAMSPSQQQQFNQVFQQQYTTAINQLQAQQMNGSGTPASPTSAGGAGNSARPLRPSRLSSSFSFSGAGPGVQILPSSAAAHMAGSQGPSGASSLSSSLNQSTSSVPGQKRGRPAASGSGQAGASGTGQNGAPNKKKKKRITISDEESLLEEGASEDAEGDLDDESMLIDYDAGENPKTSRRPGGRTSSRGGTPMSGVPTPASAAFNLTNNAAGGPRGANKAGQAGRPRPLTSVAGNKKAGKDEEEEEADAEGEEDWANEEANAEDPTLYCVCQRVSYGNMIACDNPECRLEWFHWSCVNVTKQPSNDEKWFCPDCTVLRNKANNAGGASGGNANNRQISTPTSASSSYQQLQAQQQQMMFAAQQARDGGRSSRRG